MEKPPFRPLLGFNRQSDEPVDDLGIAQTRVDEQLGIHADLGKAGQSVGLIEHTAAIGQQEEVHPGQTPAAQGLECLHRGLTDQLGLLIGDAAGR